MEKYFSKKESTKNRFKHSRVELLFKYTGDDRFNCLFWVDGYLQTKGQGNCRSLWSSWSRWNQDKLLNYKAVVVGIGTDEKQNY
jgi:hypothetical protein